MDLIRYFFRTKPDLIEPMNGSVLMLLSLVSFAFVIYYIKKDYPINRTRKVLLVVFLIDICMRYTWYFVGKYSGLTESLPLYHCRVTVLLCNYI